MINSSYDFRLDYYIMNRTFSVLSHKLPYLSYLIITYYARCVSYLEFSQAWHSSSSDLIISPRGDINLYTYILTTQYFLFNKTDIFPLFNTILLLCLWFHPFWFFQNILGVILIFLSFFPVRASSSIKWLIYNNRPRDCGR